MNLLDLVKELELESNYVLEVCGEEITLVDGVVQERGATLAKWVEQVETRESVEWRSEED